MRGAGSPWRCGPCRAAAGHHLCHPNSATLGPPAVPALVPVGGGRCWELDSQRRRRPAAPTTSVWSARPCLGCRCQLRQGWLVGCLPHVASCSTSTAGVALPVHVVACCSYTGGAVLSGDILAAGCAGGAVPPPDLQPGPGRKKDCPYAGKALGGPWPRRDSVDGCFMDASFWGHGHCNVASRRLAGDLGNDSSL
jgi:hypothetical protein